MQLLAAFFALLFSFGHVHQMHAAQKDAFIPPAECASEIEGVVPTQQQIAMGDTGGAGASSYADAGCPGCQTITVSFNER